MSWRDSSTCVLESQRRDSSVTVQSLIEMGFGPGAATWEVEETPLGRAWNRDACGTIVGRIRTGPVQLWYDLGTIMGHLIRS